MSITYPVIMRRKGEIQEGVDPVGDVRRSAQAAKRLKPL